MHNWLWRRGKSALSFVGMYVYFVLLTEQGQVFRLNVRAEREGLHGVLEPCVFDYYTCWRLPVIASADGCCLGPHRPHQGRDLFCTAISAPQPNGSESASL
jgi:hypothetical protein